MINTGKVRFVILFRYLLNKLNAYGTKRFERLICINTVDIKSSKRCYWVISVANLVYNVLFQMELHPFIGYLVSASNNKCNM